VTKILKLILAILLSVTFSGCSNNKDNNQEEKLKSVPQSFYTKYEHGDFDRFNSYASENGLAGTKIWIEGSFNDINTIESEDFHIMHTTLTDTDGNKWLLVLDIEEVCSRDKYVILFDHQVFVICQYDGYSDVFDMPAVYLDTMYDRNTGNLKSSIAFSNLNNDNPQPDNNKQEEKEPEPEPVKEETNSIRPDVKEAIDAYEAFIDEYIAFMTKYSESDNSLEMLADYMIFMGKSY
jgi:hypothetical protein